MKNGISDANYLYKNNSIYFNSRLSIDEISQTAIHECIHYLQEVKDKRNNLLRMGLCDYTEFKIYGLGLNEAAVQLMASKANKSHNEEVKYFDINFSTISPFYYPLECCLLNELAYITGEKILFESTFFSNDDFKYKFAELTSKKEFIAIQNSFDDIMDKEEKIVKLNNKITKVDDRNKNIDEMINKINELKNEIKLVFLRTQNLIISSYFDAAFDRITKLNQINVFRKKLYNFRDYIGTADNYTFFDDYYIEKVAALEHKANVIENGGTETAINIRIEEKENFILVLFKKIKELIFGKARQKENNIN